MNHPHPPGFRFSRQVLLASAVSALLATANAASPQTEARINALMKRMTPDEKIAQIVGAQLPDNKDPSAIQPAALQTILPLGIGTLSGNEMQFGIEDDVAVKNRIQTFAKTQTRLGIPVLFHGEAAHGLMKPESTSFPMPIGLASSWNDALVEKIFQVTAREMRARGDHLALAPVLDVARDPRWGRIEETLGEDPVLVGRLGAAMVRGLQGSAHGVVPGHVMATLKHLVGHGASEGGRNRSPASLGPNELRQVHLAPFAYVIRHANPAAIMPSYNEVDGIPSHANRWLLQDVVRGHLGFKGHFVSDYGGIGMLTAHGVTTDPEDAARTALDAGVQLEVLRGTTFPTLRKAMDTDPLVRAKVDDAVRAMLRLKFDMGLFDNAMADPAQAQRLLRAPETQALALTAARQSIVLLKNNPSTLPLDANQLKRIAVVGPNADITRLGGYSGMPLSVPSILDAVRARVGNGTQVVHAQGVNIVAKDARNSFANWKQENTALADRTENLALIASAKEAVKGSDVIVLVIGETESLTRESWGVTHLGDRTSLDLPGEQTALAQAMFDTGIPVVVYLMHGRPYALGEILPRAAAVLDGWYAGQATAQAATDILFGDTNPSGKLAVSLPRSVGQVPTYHAKKPYSGRFGYLFEDAGALLPFGHGLSYTTFNYGQPQLGQTRITKGKNTWLDIDITNTGKRDGDEIVQLYVRDEVSLPTRPLKELRDYQRVSLKPGETKRIRFDITEETLGALNERIQFQAEPGWFTLTVGPSSASGQATRLEMVAPGQAQAKK